MSHFENLIEKICLLENLEFPVLLLIVLLINKACDELESRLENF